MVQGFFASDSFPVIEVVHPGQEFDRQRVGMGDKGGKRNPGLDGKRLDILPSTRRANTTKNLRWCSQIVQGSVEPIDATKRLWVSNMQGYQWTLTPCR